MICPSCRWMSLQFMSENIDVYECFCPVSDTCTNSEPSLTSYKRAAVWDASNKFVASRHSCNVFCSKLWLVEPSVPNRRPELSQVGLFIAKWLHNPRCIIMFFLITAQPPFVCSLFIRTRFNRPCKLHEHTYGPPKGPVQLRLGQPRSLFQFTKITGWGQDHRMGT